MARRKATAKVQVPVRMPEALRAQLERSAKAKGPTVSLNAEIVHRLTQSFLQEEINQAVRTGVREEMISVLGQFQVRGRKK